MVTIPILEGMRSDQTRLQKGPKDHKHKSGNQNLWLKLRVGKYLALDLTRLQWGSKD